MTNLIVIDNKIEEVEISSYQENVIEVGTREYILFESFEDAGEAAAKHYRDMAENDKEEFICIIGKETLIDWAIGHNANNANNFEEWLEIVADHPEEYHASYDGDTIESPEMNNNLMNALGFDSKIDVVMFRRN